MGKDPALLLYTSDFLTGNADLTMEERGQLITLLCLHHQKGRLTKKLINLSVPNVSKDVLAKFKKDKKGLYYNERLEKVAENRRLHSIKQSENAMKRWDKERAKKNAKVDAMEDAMAMPLENENENENEEEKENGLLREKILKSANDEIVEDNTIDIIKDELYHKCRKDRIYNSNNHDVSLDDPNHFM